MVLCFAVSGQSCLKFLSRSFGKNLRCRFDTEFSTSDTPNDTPAVSASPNRVIACGSYRGVQTGNDRHRGKRVSRVSDNAEHVAKHRHNVFSNRRVIDVVIALPRLPYLHTDKQWHTHRREPVKGNVGVTDFKRPLAHAVHAVKRVFPLVVVVALFRQPGRVRQALCR